MIEYFEILRTNEFLFLVSLLGLIVIAQVIDWTFGWSNARFNKNVEFVSGLAIYGIVNKMKNMIILVFFMIMSLLIFPSVLAVPSLTALYLGYLFSEINSILSHLGKTNDGKQGELFITFIKRLMNGKDGIK